MLVPSLFVTCLLALMGVLRGLSTDSIQSWLSQPTLSSRMKSLGMISPPDHLTLAADPSTTTSLTTDSWTPAPLVNGTPTGAQPARASDLPFYSVRHGLDLPVRIADSRHRATRVLFVVIVCLGLSVGGASVTVLLISKTTDVVTRTPSASDRSCLDHNIDTQAVCTLPRRSVRRHAKKAKLRHSSSCPHALWNPDISVAADKLRCDTGVPSTYLPQPTLRTTKPIQDPRSSGHTTRKVFGVDPPLRTRSSLSDIDDGSYLRDALGLIDWSDIPPQAGYWPALDEADYPLSNTDKPGCHFERPAGWYLPDDQFRAWVFPRTHYTDRSEPDGHPTSVAGEG